ncbi:hypothetical protein DLM85_05615 [Hymenobacter edaphi]|uniref:Uncharacterized protein n=1 Tax=Hymenobacter edaphi TaxID=2211146 RepID=A0A328BSS2_9BACT|nr:hypothetical protein DLM85_05615 [Hymenobacter edaphi]
MRHARQAHDSALGNVFEQQPFHLRILCCLARSGWRKQGFEPPSGAEIVDLTMTVAVLPHLPQFNVV